MMKVKVLTSLAAFLLAPVQPPLGREGGGLATSDAVVVTAVTAIAVGGLILYEYIRRRGGR